MEDLKMKFKLEKYLLLGFASLVLSACNVGESNNNFVSSPKVADRLAYSTASSIKMMSSFNVDIAECNVNKRLLKVPDANKKEVETLLPHLEAIFDSKDNVISEISESDRSEFSFKQTITIKDIDPSNNEVYTLYFNVTSSADTDDIIEDLPKSADEIVFDKSDKSDEPGSGDVSPDNGSNVETSEANPPASPRARLSDDDDDDDDEFDDIDDDEDVDIDDDKDELDDVDDDEDADEVDEKDDDDDDDFDRHGEEKESTSVFAGVALNADSNEYKFMMISTEEVEDDEIEKAFALRMFKSEHSYIDVIHETEVEDNESETTYKYDLVVKGISSYSFIVETEVEGINNDNQIEITINNNEYEFKIIVIDEVTYIKVKYEDDNNEYEKLTYKKEVTILEDGSTSISYVEVIK